jgi:hypothetical protein
MTLQMGWGFLWSAGSTGFARVWAFNFRNVKTLLTLFDRSIVRSNMANIRVLLNLISSIIV